MKEIMKNESWIELAQALSNIGWGIEKLQWNGFRLELLLEALPPKPQSEKTKTMETCKEVTIVHTTIPHCRCCCDKVTPGGYGGGGGGNGGGDGE